MDLVELAKQNTNLRHPWETTRINIVAEKITKWLKQHDKLTSEVTILDVGSGDAYVIDQLASKFKNVNFVAVDTYYDKSTMELLQSNFTNADKIRLFDSWEEFGKQDYSIDLILLLDVIEHVPDDISFLKEINGYVKSDFHFIITVPAFQSLFTQHDTFLKHYRRYNNRLLKSNIREADWEPQQTGYFYMIALCMRTLGKIKESISKAKVSDKGISEWTSGAGFTKLVNSILWIDYKIGSFFRALGINLPGLSNFTVGKRSVK